MTSVLMSHVREGERQGLEDGGRRGGPRGEGGGGGKPELRGKGLVACGLGLQRSEKYCGLSKMDTTYRLPLNVYVIVLGIGLLKQQGTREQFSYNEVVLKGAGKKLSLLGQTCAVCLEEFRTRDELAVCPCSHAFHKKCLLKWLEIRSVCPMCNKPILRLHPDPTQGTEGPQDPEEVTLEEELDPLHRYTQVDHTRNSSWANLAIRSTSEEEEEGEAALVESPPAGLRVASAAGGLGGAGRLLSHTNDSSTSNCPARKLLRASRLELQHAERDDSTSTGEPSRVFTSSSSLSLESSAPRAAEAGFRALSAASQENPPVTCSLAGCTGTGFTTSAGSDFFSSSSSSSSSSLKYTSTPLSLSSPFPFFLVFFFLETFSAGPYIKTEDK
ncbi:unnamed protein product [Coregonus sp. 'balchen']|nr:unnamed protein product [Coregonus sp. 'balchen']